MENPNPGHRNTVLPKSKTDTSRRSVWDCGSSLYDSFELRSFQKDLHSAMAASRTFSMPRSTVLPCVPPQPEKTGGPKIARAFQRLLRRVLKPKRNYNDKENAPPEEEGFVKELPKERFYYVFYDKSEALATIPEVPEFDAQAVSLGRRKLVRRTTSARVTVPASSVGIYC